jgi:hypothetical protein
MGAMLRLKGNHIKHFNRFIKGHSFITSRAAARALFFVVCFAIIGVFVPILLLFFEMVAGIATF